MKTHGWTVFRPRMMLAIAGSLALACMLTGCKQFSGPGLGFSRSTTLEAASRDGAKRLAPEFITSAYFPVDENTAEVYLSDIPAERFLDPKDTLADAKGSLLHVHVFLIPSAGNTPIDTTACNVTFRHLILTGGASMGLYAGGGFWLPKDDVGDETLGGSITGSSHRLTRSTPNFTDLLGSGTLTGSFAATADDTLAKAMGGKFEQLTRRLPASTIPEDPEAPKKTKPRPGDKPAKGGSSGK